MVISLYVDTANRNPSFAYSENTSLVLMVLSNIDIASGDLDKNTLSHLAHQKPFALLTRAEGPRGAASGMQRV